MQCELPANLVFEIVDQRERGVLPELRATRVVGHGVAERGSSFRHRDAIAGDLGSGAEAFPADDLLGIGIDDDAEAFDRCFRFASGELTPAFHARDQRSALVAERRFDARECKRATTRIAAGWCELQVRQLTHHGFVREEGLGVVAGEV
ncbi:hypothetical protein D3C83_07740 [compost metagenome]